MNMNLLNKSEQKKKQDLMQIKDRWQIKNRFSIKNVNTSKCKRNQVPISDINTFEQQIFFEKILCSNIDFLLFTIKNYSNRFLFNFYTINKFKHYKNKKNAKNKKTSSNLIQIFQQFEKCLIIKKNTISRKPSITFIKQDNISTTRNDKTREIKINQESKRRIEMTFLIQDHFSVLFCIKKKIIFLSYILNIKDFSDLKKSCNIEYASRKVLSQIEVYNYLIPIEQQQSKEEIKKLHRKSKIQINEFIKILQFDHCDTVENDELKRIISEINFFVLHHSNYSFELKTNWSRLVTRFSEIEKRELMEDSIFEIISGSFENIKKMNQKSFKRLSKKERNSNIENVNRVIKSINTFYDFIMNDKSKKQSKEIEKILFKVVFNRNQKESKLTNAFSVFEMHDILIKTTESIFSLTSTTGSGKTRCAPFFFAIKTIEDNMTRPFFIMTQPRFSVIKTKINDIRKLFGDTIQIITNSNKIIRKYEKYSNNIKYNFNPKFEKPIFGIFTSRTLLDIIQKVDQMNIDICSITRFCLDEIHERTVESDVLSAILSKRINEMISTKHNFPLQILMMSATPDSRVYNCFKNVNRFRLPSSYLYPIDTIHQQVQNMEEINPAAANQTMKIIERMATKTIDRGHILVFASGNYSMNNLIRIICNEFDINNRFGNTLVKVIKRFDSLFEEESIEKFYTNLEKYIEQETRKSTFFKDILFILPVKYLGFVSNEQKEICLNPIPQHPNVIKVIFATNVIESSVTIQDLIAVVDSGTYINKSFNLNSQYYFTSEEIISIQNQEQRKGRVGRHRSGIAVQITVENKPNPVSLPPAILTSNISYNILSLRQIGYKIEEIENLPDKINDNDLEKYISELKSLKALTEETNELTTFGRILVKFDSFYPLFSASILSISGYKYNECEMQRIDNFEEKEINEKNLKVILGCLISLIISNSSLILNDLSIKLRQFFDKRSDIITLLRTILDLAQLDKQGILDSESDYGLDSKKVISMLCNLQKIIENLFFSNNEIQDNRYYTKIKNKRENFIWKTIFKLLKKYVEELGEDLYTFIQEFFKEIGKNKPEWIEARKAKFININCFSKEPCFNYKGNDICEFSKQSIFVSKRPGSIGLDSPSSCLIFSVSNSSVNNQCYGELIHSLGNDDDINEFIPHPISVETSKMLDNDFSLQLLESYFCCSDHFLRYESLNTLFYKSKEMITNSEGQECTLISFIPKERSSIQEFIESVEKLEKLIPFTPSTLLVKNSDLNCVVSLYGDGTSKINSTVHSFYDNDFFAYRFDKETIEYLIENIEQIKKCPDTLSIAITGESMCYPLTKYDCPPCIRRNELYRPQSFSSTPYVFNIEQVFHNHLVMVSNTRIKNFESYVIPWIQESRYGYDYEENSLIQRANNVAKNTITFSHSLNRLIFSTPESILQVKGRAAPSYGIEDIPKCLGPISRMFYLCALQHIQGVSLTSPLTLNGFYYRGKQIAHIPEINEIQFSRSRYIGNSCYCLDVKYEDEIDEVENKVYDLCHKNGIHHIYRENVPVFSAIIRHRKHSNLSRNEFVDRVNSVLDQFGGVIAKRFEYAEFIGNEIYRGMIKVLMYCADFTVPLANMLKEVIEESEIETVFNILCNNYDEDILTDVHVKKSLTEWFEKQNISIDAVTLQLIGKEEENKDKIEKAIIEMKENPPQLPFKSYPIPEHFNILQISRHVKYMNREKQDKWHLNKITRTLIVPKNVNEEEIIEFMNQFQKNYNKNVEEEDDILWEIFLHDEEPELSRHLINIFSEDGRMTQKHFCVECLYQSLVFNLRKMYNKDEDCCSMKNIYEDILPLSNISFVENSSSERIPFGQMIWSLVKEQKISNQIKTWITALSIRSIMKSSKITFCPLHPHILLPVPPAGAILDCSVDSCDFCYCFMCNEWHQKGKCSKDCGVSAGCRICPFCKEEIVKSQCCNHIHCHCGRDFCYYCGEGFDSDHDCYEHMNSRGHWKEAPDYEKFVKNNEVNEEDLNKFYEDYPQWKPKWMNNDQE